MYTRKPKLALALLLFFVFVDVAIPDKIYTDYDPSVNFSQYRTFMWIKPPHMPDPLMSRKLIWRWKATDISPEDPKKTTKKLNEDIEKLFKKFPPK